MSVWLLPNRRVLVAAAVPTALCALAGLWLANILAPVAEPALWAVVGGWTLVAAAALSGVFLAWQYFTPRMAYAQGELLVYLRSTSPLRVPIDAVECFLLGQAGTLLTATLPERTTALTVRLSEKLSIDGFRTDVHRLLGGWCGNNITIRGTWCEPLSVPLVYDLNAKLAEAQRAWSEQVAREQAAGSPAATTATPAAPSTPAGSSA